MKRIIMTGGSDGLGKAFAKLCVKENIEIVCLSRSKPDYPCIHIETDLAEETSMKNACDQIKKDYFSFDALVNCAGLISVQAPDKITYDELESVMRVNSIAPIYLTSLLFDLIKKNESDVMNVGSTVGTKAYANQAAYGTSKWALRGTSLNFQLELAKTRCRVIQFNPGGMVTEFFKKYNGETIKDPSAWMKPEDVAAVMLYTLKLPKQLEVSEILINRKSA